MHRRKITSASLLTWKWHVSVFRCTFWILLGEIKGPVHSTSGERSDLSSHPAEDINILHLMIVSAILQNNFRSLNGGGKRRYATSYNSILILRNLTKTIFFNSVLLLVCSVTENKPGRSVLVHFRGHWICPHSVFLYEKIWIKYKLE